MQSYPTNWHVVTPSSQGRYLRVYLFVAGFFYSFWSLIIHLFLNAPDEPMQRLVVSTLMVGTALASYFSNRIHRRLEALTLILNVILMAHLFSMIVAFEFHFLYVLGAPVVFSVQNLGFFKAKTLAWYSAVCLLVILYLCVNWTFTLDTKICFFAFVATVQANALISLYQRNIVESRVDTLIENMLPTQISERLKVKSGSIADHFESATVLFADIVGFTEMTRDTKPHQIVTMLDQLFTRIDGLSEKYCVEKIKTIGDCYMVAAGIPIPSRTHLWDILNFALELKQCVRDFSKETGREVHMRIGVNSGPVVAGVIGRKKTIYDLWGETVNVASRMESHGRQDVIQVPFEIAEKALAFSFSEPYLIDIKGMGKTKVCQLLSLKKVSQDYREVA